MIYGETIKNAFAQRLKELYPNVAIFKEKEDEADIFPNFFILQLTMDSREDRKDHYFINYFMTVRYRETADINTEPKLQQKLDKMGADMLINFVDIPLNGLTKKIRNCHYEKIDGVLHFFANVTIQVAKNKEIQNKMINLQLKTHIRNTDKKGD